jgi:hypothetical protein
MKHLMIDLEMLSTHPAGVIVSIGAVFFDPQLDDPLGATFYRIFKLQPQIDAGLKIDEDTLQWWLGQTSQVHRQLLTPDKDSPVQILYEFEQYYKQHSSDPDQTLMWSWPATADLIWLQHNYLAFNMDPPWKYYQNQCMATIKNRYPNLILPQNNQHNALADAVWQADYLCKLTRKHDISLHRVRS